MDRTIPNSGNEDIELYVRTYYSLLRSTRAVKISTLIEAHTRMHSALHVKAASHQPDMSAFLYALLRLPPEIEQTNLVLMGQSSRVFAQHGYPDVENWQMVSALGRRRRTFYHPEKQKMAVYIASRSDIDDLIPILTAYQLERNKLQMLLSTNVAQTLLDEIEQEGGEPTGNALIRLAKLAEMPSEDMARLVQIWGEQTAVHLRHITNNKQSIAVRSLAGSLADYKRATRRWWQNVEDRVPDCNLDECPVYFVSSNTHSLANILSGYALSQRQALQTFVDAQGSETLKEEYQNIQAERVPSNEQNFLYYVLKKYEAAHPDTVADRVTQERQAGIRRVPSAHAFDIEVQVIHLNQLPIEQLDPRLQVSGWQQLRHSPAVIVNIDYPLGMAAYQVLSEIGRNIAEMCGVYIMGKAATLNGRIGDVMIPSVVHDEHSRNTYLFRNCFTADDIVPHLVYGNVMDNQKAITVPGTFLQNDQYMSVFYKEGYTDMEMEAGPYLSGVYEMSRPKRHPYNEIVNLHNIDVPVGMLHYASDTPFSKGKNLGAQNLSYYGVDATYATTIAIARAILQEEIRRIG